MLDGENHAVEHTLEFQLEQLLQLRATFNALAQGTLAQVFEHNRGGGGAYVGRQQKRLERLEGGFVHLAGERDDGIEGLRERLAGAGDGLPHAVEEAALGHTGLIGRRRAFGDGLRPLLLDGRRGVVLLVFAAPAEEGESHAELV